MHGEYQEGESVIVAGAAQEEGEQRITREPRKSTNSVAKGYSVDAEIDCDSDDGGSGSEAGESEESTSEDHASRKNSQGSLTATVIAGSSVVSTSATDNLKWLDISTTGGKMTGASSFGG